MTRTILKQELKELYHFLLPLEKEMLCQKYKSKYVPHVIGVGFKGEGQQAYPALDAFGYDKEDIKSLKGFLYERAYGMPMEKEAKEVSLEEQNAKISEFVQKL